MPAALTATVNGKPRKVVVKDGLAVFRAKKGGTVELRHRLTTRRVKGQVAGADYETLWRGPDVIDLLPHGEPLRLYQRTLGIPKHYPVAPKKSDGKSKGFVAAPTQQK